MVDIFFTSLPLNVQLAKADPNLFKNRVQIRYGTISNNFLNVPFLFVLLHLKPWIFPQICVEIFEITSKSLPNVYTSNTKSKSVKNCVQIHLGTISNNSLNVPFLFVFFHLKSWIFSRFVWKFLA